AVDERRILTVASEGTDDHLTQDDVANSIVPLVGDQDLTGSEADRSRQQEHRGSRRAERAVEITAGAVAGAGADGRRRIDLTNAVIAAIGHVNDAAPRVDVDAGRAIEFGGAGGAAGSVDESWRAVAGDRLHDDLAAGTHARVDAGAGVRSDATV